MLMTILEDWEKIELAHQMGPSKSIIFLTVQTKLCIVVDKR